MIGGSLVVAGSQDRHQSVLGAHHHRLPRLRLLPHRLGVKGRSSAGRLGECLGKLLDHVIVYMALFDGDDGVPWQKIKSTEAKTCASDSDHSDGAGPDFVTQHQLTVAVAPPKEFTNVPTANGD